MLRQQNYRQRNETRKSNNFTYAEGWQSESIYL